MSIAIVLSGGTGNRLGTDIPKQYIEVNGKPIIAYCLETIEKCTMIDAIQIVAEESWRNVILETYSFVSGSEFVSTGKLRGFSKPGTTRQLSILSALEDVRRYASDKDVVVIHDAARPLLSANLLENVVKAVERHDGAIPVLPMKDTVYLSEDGERITSLLERSKVCAGQAPEGFVLGKYYEANMRLLPEEILKINGSTEPAVLAGMDIAVVAGDERNFKITTLADLKRFEQIVNGMDGETD